MFGYPLGEGSGVIFFPNSLKFNRRAEALSASGSVYTNAIAYAFDQARKKVTLAHKWESLVSSNV